MKTCQTCDWCERDGKNPWGWLCMYFPQNEVDPIGGGVLPPYKYCRDVRRISVRTQAEGFCKFWSAKPEEKEPVIKETVRGKSVTFKESKNV